MYFAFQVIPFLDEEYIISFCIKQEENIWQAVLILRLVTKAYTLGKETVAHRAFSSETKPSSIFHVLPISSLSVKKKGSWSDDIEDFLFFTSRYIDKLIFITY